MMRVYTLSTLERMTKPTWEFVVSVVISSGHMSRPDEYSKMTDAGAVHGNFGRTVWGRSLSTQDPNHLII